MKTTKLKIGDRNMRLFSGKLEDRKSGATPLDDVYMKMHRAGASDVAGCTIEVTADELLELCEEIDFAINPNYGRDHYTHPEDREARLDLAAAKRLYNRCDRLATELLGPAPQVAHLRVVK